MAHTGVCTKLKERHINLQCAILPILTISTFGSMYKAEKQDVYFATLKLILNVIAKYLLFGKDLN